jgi:hypothetical protein
VGGIASEIRNQMTKAKVMIPIIDQRMKLADRFGCLPFRDGRAGGFRLRL